MTMHKLLTFALTNIIYFSYFSISATFLFQLYGIIYLYIHIKYNWVTLFIGLELFICFTAIFCPIYYSQIWWNLFIWFITAKFGGIYLFDLLNLLQPNLVIFIYLLVIFATYVDIYLLHFFKFIVFFYIYFIILFIYLLFFI